VHNAVEKAYSDHYSSPAVRSPSNRACREKPKFLGNRTIIDKDDSGMAAGMITDRRWDHMAFESERSTKDEVVRLPE
jgi:hypothetical protein